jgi:hypothetical protein
MPCRGPVDIVVLLAQTHPADKAPCAWLRAPAPRRVFVQGDFGGRPGRGITRRPPQSGSPKGGEDRGDPGPRRAMARAPSAREGPRAAAHQDVA